jgi:hypothetical protein
MTNDDRARIADLLRETAEAHHGYEEDVLGGERDEAWARWYADRLLERRLGDLVERTPSAGELAGLLEEATEARQREGPAEEWQRFASDWIVERLGARP